MKILSKLLALLALIVVVLATHSAIGKIVRGANPDPIITLSTTVSNGQVIYRVDVAKTSVVIGDFNADLYVNGAKVSHILGPSNIGVGGQLSFGSPGSGANFTDGLGTISLSGTNNVEVRINYAGNFANNHLDLGCDISPNGASNCASVPVTPPQTPTCSVVPGSSCGLVTDPAINPDINIKLRGFNNLKSQPTKLSYHDGPTDDKAPKLNTLFQNGRIPVFTATYSVGSWDGVLPSRSSDDPQLAGFQVTPGEQILVPQSGYDIGCGGGAMILYADTNSVTLKYTREDNVISGYTIHILGVSVSSDILTEYAAANSSVPKRVNLPSKPSGVGIGQAIGNEIWVSVRDTGSFMDPLSCKDWWPGCTNVYPWKNKDGSPLLPPVDPVDPPSDPNGPRAARDPLCDLSNIPRYPPLGSLQSCPQETDALKSNSCIPTQGTTQCTSTCGDPLTLNETLGMSIYGNCALGTCKASIKLTPDSQLKVPLAKDLADYFAGTLDSGAVFDKTITQAELDKIKANIASANRDPVLEAAFYSRSGVAKKLLPVEIQDNLRCQFLKYIKQKIDGGKNTKYKTFTVDGVLWSNVKRPPNCQTRQADNSWQNDPLGGRIWSDIPLFNNDNSLGKIEFVAPGVYTPPIAPIETSVPEIRRLYSVTNILQQALVPAKILAQLAKTPTQLGLTIGPEIRPEINLSSNACNQTRTLEDLYKNSPKPQIFSDPKYKNKTAYELGVKCQQPSPPPDNASPVCTVGPDGQINCFQQVPSSIVKANHIYNLPEVKVQVRNVNPYLYDTFSQTIDKSRGLFTIFKPVAVDKNQNAEFEKSFDPLPAESNKIKYQLDFEQGVSLKPEPGGWKLLFDKLGGIWTAKEFVLKLLNPSNNK